MVVRRRSLGSPAVAEVNESGQSEDGDGDDDGSNSGDDELGGDGFGIGVGEVKGGDVGGEGSE